MANVNDSDVFPAGTIGSVSSATGLTFTEATEPTTPSTNDLILYVDSVDGVLKQKTDAGVVTKVGSPTVTDSEFRIQDNSDATKQIAFEASGITTGTTRTLTVLDNSGTIAVAGTLTDKALYYYDDTSKLFKPIGIGATDQALLAKPSLDPPYQFGTVASSGREVLTANRTYYVRTNGSDSNDGLTNSSGGAFLTMQKAVDVVSGLDISIYDVTIQLGAGTFAGATIKPLVGAGKLILRGDPTTPSNVTINSQILSDGISNIVQVLGFTLLANSGTGDISSKSGSVLEITGNCRFASTGSIRHIYAETNGVIRIKTNYSITGSSLNHLFALMGGIIQYTETGYTTTLTGTPAFSIGFADASRTGIINIPSIFVTYSGSATGIRYNVATNGIIFTAGGSSTYFPGNLPGTTATGGEYT